MADRITVLRRGKVVGTAHAGRGHAGKLAQMMVGRRSISSVDKARPSRASPCSRSRTSRCSTTAVMPRCATWRLVRRARRRDRGVAGVQGNGQTELVEAITGLRQRAGGKITHRGQRHDARPRPRRSLELGVAHVPEDRQRDGLVPCFTDRRQPGAQHLLPAAVRARAGHATGRDVADGASERRRAVRRPHAERRSTSAGTLSGGNQQKVIVAREFTRPIKLLVAAQPTRGLDVGSIEYIHQRLVEKRDEGCAVLLVSTELDEVMALSDRIAVMYQRPDRGHPRSGRGDAGAAGAVHGRGAGPGGGARRRTRPRDLRVRPRPRQTHRDAAMSDARVPASSTGSAIRADQTSLSPRRPSSPADPPSRPSPVDPPSRPSPAGSGAFPVSSCLPFLAVLTALLIGAFLIVLSDPVLLALWTTNPLKAAEASARGSPRGVWGADPGALGSPRAYVEAFAYRGHRGDQAGVFGPLSESLVTATPFIFAGLAVAVGFRSGLFNIGAEGQLYLGAIFATFVGFSFTGLPGSSIFRWRSRRVPRRGAVGLHPRILKARPARMKSSYHHDELHRLPADVDWLLTAARLQRPGRPDPVIAGHRAGGDVPRFFPDPSGSTGFLHRPGVRRPGLLVPVPDHPGLRVPHRRAQPGAARYAGMSITRNIVLAMCLCGGARRAGRGERGLGVNKRDAGLLTRLRLRRHRHRPAWQEPSRWVSSWRPCSSAPCAAAPRRMQAATGIPIDLISVIQALVIVFIAAPAIIREIYRIKARQATGTEILAQRLGEVGAPTTAVMTTTRRSQPAGRSHWRLLYFAVRIVLGVRVRLRDASRGRIPVRPEPGRSCATEQLARSWSRL